MGHPALSFTGLTPDAIEKCVRSFLKQNPTSMFQKLHITAVHPHELVRTRGGVINVRSVQVGMWDIDDDADGVLIIASTINWPESHSICMLADYAMSRLHYLDSLGQGMPVWLDQFLHVHLPYYGRLNHVGLSGRQQYQPATCGVWTVANAVRLLHGLRPFIPADLEESNAFLEKWLCFVANQTAVS